MHQCHAGPAQALKRRFGHPTSDVEAGGWSCLSKTFLSNT